MNVGFEVKSSQQWMLNCEYQNPVSELIGTKPSEFKSYRKTVKLRLLFTRTPAQLLGPRILSKLTGPAWDACDGREPQSVASDDGVNVTLQSLAGAIRCEHETELFDALEDTVNGPGRKKGEQLHDNALRVQTNVRELAKQGVRLPDQAQGFLVLRWANLSTQARIAFVTLAGNSLSFWRCEEGVQVQRRRVSARPEGARCAQVANSPCVTGKRSQGCNRGAGRRD